MTYIFKTKSILLFVLLFSLLIVISCKKKYDPEEEALKMRGKADSLLRIAYTKYDSNNLDGAYELCNAAISANSGDPRALTLMGRINFKIENYSRAIELYSMVIDSPGDLQKFHYQGLYEQRAIAKEALKDYRGALVDYNILVNSYNSRYGYYHRGILKYNFLDDANGACSDWSIAGEKGESRAYDLINKFCNN